MEIGQRISKIRKEKKLTLKDVTVMSGVASSLISQIENDKANPSLATLMALAKAYDVNVVDFFSKTETREHGVVIRSSERTLFRKGISAEYYLLTTELFDELEFLYCVYEKGGRSSANLESHTHGHEAGFVISGKLKVEIDEEVYVLNSGDSISFDSTRKHRITNLMDGRTLAIWVDTPAIY